MAIDFGNIPRTKTAKRPVDPIELFQSLKVNDPAVNDLWLAQGDALRQWHLKRGQADIAIVLNTGAGKTLVGLLCAGSLVNETSEKVLYACSSIQLVEQTAAKARGYGLEVATYFHRQFNNDQLYHRGLAPCITTYQALFNGKSRFFREEFSAVVFDDSHAAEHLLRDHFTLRIKQDGFPELFSQISQLFRAYFERVGMSVGYVEALERHDPLKQWFVPPFAVREQFGELKRLLVGAKPTDQPDILFAWEHLKDRIDLCSVFVSGAEIVLTPPVVPARTLPYFKRGVRRLYLSATLAAKDGFLRTFGRVPDTTIAPSTTAGECERLVIIPSLRDDCEDEVDTAKDIIRRQKALILVPSYRRAEQWHDVVAKQEGDDTTVQVENFKKAKAPAKLLLVSRYDGVDLPGDTCRITVIDDLPSGVGPLERYLWEQLGLVKQLRSTVASRVIQSFGRISRGMSDHGVVILTGSNLVNWLLATRNRKALPQFLRRQLELGVELSKQASSMEDLIGSAKQCLERDPGWLQYYKDNMGESDPARDAESDEEALFLTQCEVNFGWEFWSRNYEEAAKYLEQSLDKTFSISTNTGAWHSLWLGYCYELLGDQNGAQQFYRKAHSASKNIPPFDLQPSPSATDRLPPQVLEVSRYLYSGSGIRRDVLGKFDQITVFLDGNGSSSQTEEALRVVGEHLGLVASRPEKEFGTGPDVLWDVPGGPALCQEVKAGKRDTSHYRKEDLGQLRDHVRWTKEHSQSSLIVAAFVGPVAPASPQSNPDPEIIIIELSEFKELANRLRAALDDICSTAMPLTLRQKILAAFEQRDLLWPQLLDSMKRTKLKDVQASR